MPEVDASQVLTQRRNGEGPLLLDCREPYEWRAARIPDSVHIPMRQIPQRLDELNREAEITVVCAHGVRSYSVAAYLIQNGFQAQSLKGGLEMWQMRGGEVERGR